MTIDQVILSVIGLINVGCFIYAANVISNMGSVISGQKSLIDSMKSYQDMIDPEKIKQMTELEVRRKELLIESGFNSKMKELTTKYYQETVQHFDTKTESIIASWNEMSKWIAAAILSQFPTYASRTERNQWIKERYPLSEEFLVELVDHFQLETPPIDKVS